MTACLGMKRVQIKLVGALAVFALLFAQIGLAAYACPNLSRGPGAGNETAAELPCADMDSQQPAVCHEHCKDQAGLDQVQPAGVPSSMAMASSLVLPLFDAHRATIPASCAGPDPARVTAPPPSILFCVFRT